MSIGLYGAGMHQFVLDEMELGSRVAQQLDDPEQWLWVSLFAWDVFPLPPLDRGSLEQVE